LVCDGHHITRQGVVSILARDPGLSVVGEVARPEGAVSAVERVQPDVMVINHDPEVLDAVELTECIVDSSRAAGCVVPGVLMLSRAGRHPGLPLRAIRAGVCGVVPHDSAPGALLAAVRSVADGALVLRDADAVEVVRRLVERLPGSGGPAPAGLGGLTRREVDVLALVAQGLANREIAEELSLTEATVKSHLYRLSRKLGLRDRTQAAIFAYESGLVRVSPRSSSPG
jgi:DNA-binding NarL/FixJ family response regulator